MQNTITKALNWRLAVNSFDTSKTVSAEDLNTILESGRLSPSSYGLEAWKFIVVENPELREKIKEAGYGQSKITEASHLIALTYRTDVRESISNERISRTAKITGVSEDNLAPFKKMIDGAIGGMNDTGLEAWTKAQTYIPLGIMMQTASMLGIDSGPMEGFDANKVNDILGLSGKNLKVATLLAIGFRGAEEAGDKPKVRRSFEEVVEFVK